MRDVHGERLAMLAGHLAPNTQVLVLPLAECLRRRQACTALGLILEAKEDPSLRSRALTLVMSNQWYADIAAARSHCSKR